MAHLLLCVPVVLLSGIVQITLSHQQTPSDAFSEKFDSQMTLWCHALISTLLVSIAPFFILFCIPLDNTDKHSNSLKVLLSFASGGLLGDAFLHLIPHAIIDEDGHSHDSHHHHDKDSNGHSHDHTQDMMIGLWVLGGIFTFLVVEKFVRLVKGHSEGIKEKEVKTESDSNYGKKFPEGLKHRNVTKQNKKEVGGSSDANQQSEIKVSAYLNLAADFSHNFTDGLAIGASYLAGRAIGIVTTFTILMHEVPHEIGDFAILIQSGYSRRKAMMLQLTTAFGALAGTVCGLMAEGLSVSATAWILPFTAGGFIYIATVSVIPELLENSSFWQSIKELLGICVGILMMILIGYFE